MGAVVRLVFFIAILLGIYLVVDPTVGQRQISCWTNSDACPSAASDDETYALKWAGADADERAVGDEPPKLQPLRRGERGGSRLWALTDDYTYCHDDSDELFLVPRGFVTDLTSIPRFARVAYNPADFAEAALVHDYIYAVGAEGWRRRGDEVFREMLIETNHSRRRSELLYRMVRFGGGNGYGKLGDWLFWNFDERKYLDNEPKPDGGPVFDTQC